MILVSQVLTFHHNVYNKNMKEFAQGKKGFTLIELLVVISIISILSAFLMANFIGVRQRGRDAQRKSEIKQLQSALELYRADNGKYPAVSGYTPTGITGVTPNYMSEIPQDPVSGNVCPSPYGYSVSSDFSKYTVYAVLENTNDFDAQKIKSTPSVPIGSDGGTTSDGYKTYTISIGCGSTAYNFWVNNP